MKKDLQDAEKLLTDLHRIHSDYAREYSYKAICRNRYRGEEKSAQEAKENALTHDGIAHGLQTGLTQVKNLLNSLK